MIARRWTELTEGERRKQDAHALLEARRDVFVNRGRRALLGALLRTGTATADDVRLAVHLPDAIDPKCFGVVPGPLVRAGIIRQCGFTKTRRAAGHARPVTVWQMLDRGAALRWLAAHPDLADPYVPDGDDLGDLFNGLNTNGSAGAAVPAAE